MVFFFKLSNKLSSGRPLLSVLIQKVSKEIKAVRKKAKILPTSLKIYNLPRQGGVKQYRFFNRFALRIS